MKLLKNVLFSVFFIFAASVTVSSCAALKDPVADGYTIEEAPTNVHAIGRSDLTFTVKSNGKPTSGLTFEVEPMMNMGTFTHITPAESIVATDNNDGTYTITVYYLMSGAWELHFHINSVHQAAHLPVTVGGSMMNKGTLKGIADKTVDPAGGATPVIRNYHIFKYAINTAGAAGTHSIDIFLATFESYLNMPAVFSTQILNDGTPAPWTVGTVTIDICNTWATSCTAWTPLTEDMVRRGHFTGTNMSIANSGTGMMPTFAVRLNVANSTAATSEWKTTDGLAGAGTGNGATEFKNINQ